MQRGNNAQFLAPQVLVFVGKSAAQEAGFERGAGSKTQNRVDVKVG
jgi:hypothetical protein